MKKETFLKIVLVALVGLFVGILILKNNNIKEQKDKTINVEPTTLLKDMMLEYGNYLVGDQKWIKAHVNNEINEINLNEIVKDENFDNTIFDYIDCDYNKTKLIIKIKDNELTFDTTLNCVVNKDKDGLYYNENRLKDKLNSYGEYIHKSIENNIKEDITIVFTLTQINDIYKYDLSMFEENYDFNKTKLYIVISNYKNGIYDVEYEVELVLKNKES